MVTFVIVTSSCSGRSADAPHDEAAFVDDCTRVTFFISSKRCAPKWAALSHHGGHQLGLRCATTGVMILGMPNPISGGDAALFNSFRTRARLPCSSFTVVAIVSFTDFAASWSRRKYVCCDPRGQIVQPLLVGRASPSIRSWCSFAVFGGLFWASRHPARDADARRHQGVRKLWRARRVARSLGLSQV